MRGSVGLLLAYRDAATSGPLAVRQRLGPLRLSRFLACSTFLLVLVPMPLLPMPDLVLSLFSASSFCYLLIRRPSSIFPLSAWHHPPSLRDDQQSGPCHSVFAKPLHCLLYIEPPSP